MDLSCKPLVEILKDAFLETTLECRRSLVRVADKTLECMSSQKKVSCADCAHNCLMINSGGVVDQ